MPPSIAIVILAGAFYGKASKRHSTGYALRFPRILRIRDDKPPEEIDTLQTVQRLSQIGKLPEPTSQVQVTNAHTDGVTSTSLEAAQDAFKAFIAVVKPDQQLVILHDSDADGITAGIVLQLALQRAGFKKVERVLPPARS
ncbi:hypothetical protein WKK05_14380 [Nostoc sp. UHCC 0302]|uniref:hypothetical protein n=1 Tax=Nostoc sp. UHCC 0302 TaxID=3134896 RepID=UPI00311CBE5C